MKKFHEATARRYRMITGSSAKLYRFVVPTTAFPRGRHGPLCSVYQKNNGEFMAEYLTLTSGRPFVSNVWSDTLYVV